MIKISENTEIFSEKENANNCLPLKEVGTFIFKMELYKPNSEYKFPEDYYALASTKKEAWEVEIPKDYKLGVFNTPNFDALNSPHLVVFYIKKTDGYESNEHIASFVVYSSLTLAENAIKAFNYKKCFDNYNETFSNEGGKNVEITLSIYKVMENVQIPEENKIFICNIVYLKNYITKAITKKMK